MTISCGYCKEVIPLEDTSPWRESGDREYKVLHICATCFDDKICALKGERGVFVRGDTRKI